MVIAAPTGPRLDRRRAHPAPPPPHGGSPPGAEGPRTRAREVGVLVVLRDRDPACDESDELVVLLHGGAALLVHVVGCRAADEAGVELAVVRDEQLVAVRVCEPEGRTERAPRRHDLRT